MAIYFIPLGEASEVELVFTPDMTAGLIGGFPFAKFAADEPMPREPLIKTAK